jgi:flotillin
MSGEGGTPTTSNFLSGMMRSIPPLNEMFKMAGMNIPGFLGTDASDVGQMNVNNEQPAFEKKLLTSEESDIIISPTEADAYPA